MPTKGGIYTREFEKGSWEVNVRVEELFVNARTDLFLNREWDPVRSVDEAIDRAGAYAAAGASGFFIPGLTNETLIGRICEAVRSPST